MHKFEKKGNGFLPKKGVKRVTYIAVLIATVLQFSCNKQLLGDLDFEVEDGWVVYRFTRAEVNRMEEEGMSDLAYFKDILNKELLENDSLNLTDTDNWVLIQLDSNTFELRKPVNKLSGSISSNTRMQLYQITEEPTTTGASQDVPFAIMDKKTSSLSIENGELHIRLDTFKNASEVNLAGDFNQWHSGSLSLSKSDSGWVTKLQLPPGKYRYKFVIDGEWKLDPFNEHSEPNEHGTGNSFFVIPNHHFNLMGFEEADYVGLTGSFTNWDHYFPMHKEGSGWNLPVYLQDGRYEYKFIVDGEWMTDPGNPKQLNNAEGHTNSLLEVGEKTAFVLEAYETAREVSLSGTFNNWSQELKMQRINGQWVAELLLPEGNYEYKFIIDGKWITDPGNPYRIPNSAGTFNSWRPVGNVEIFELRGFENASGLILTGDFNGWDEGKFRMIKKGESWVFPVALKPGRYTYKFIVDGLWMTDPANPIRQPNDIGTYNSVRWVRRAGP